MSIKRGVSLYSYQQEDFFGKMTWKDQLREVALNLQGADGIEIINGCTVPGYPMPPESFFYEWNNEMARYGLKAVTIDTYTDTLQFRDHVMTYSEVLERIKYDLHLAKKMGFRNLRLSHNVPLKVVEAALPFAEELDVRMTNECDVKQQPFGSPVLDCVDAVISFIQRTGTKHYGLQTDMSQFQNKPSVVRIRAMMRASGKTPREAHDIAEELFAMFGELSMDEIKAYTLEKYPVLMQGRFGPYRFHNNSPSILFKMLPYIFHMHGKFYDMTEIPGKPGQYEDRCLPYEEVFQILRTVNYSGYIHSEFEGQRSQQDMGYEGLVDEVEQVRRHHEMMRRLSYDPLDNITL